MIAMTVVTVIVMRIERLMVMKVVGVGVDDMLVVTRADVMSV